MADEVKSWWLDRAREPSTYQGLAVLAGIIGQFVFHSAVMGQHALDIGLALAGVIQVGKAEAVAGRDF